MQAVVEFRGEFEFLSNFAPSPLNAWGIDFPTVEHAFQAAKTLQLDERRAIAALPTPGQAKKAGRRVTLRSNWDDVRVHMMRSLLGVKFERGTVLAQLLLDTGTAPLLEGNWWGDAFWGVDLKTGRGRNTLGFLLMEQRHHLRS